MSDLRKKILQKMSDHVLASFATVTEDGKPWTRYVVVKADDQMNIWFATLKIHGKYTRLIKIRKFIWCSVSPIRKQLYLGSKFRDMLKYLKMPRQKRTFGTIF